MAPGGTPRILLEPGLHLLTRDMQRRDQTGQQTNQARDAQSKRKRHVIDPDGVDTRQPRWGKPGKCPYSCCRNAQAQRAAVISRVLDLHRTAMDHLTTRSRLEQADMARAYAIGRAEAVEAAAGFMELHKKHWPGWEGETEIRQVFGP